MENQVINDTCSFLNQHYYNKSLHDEITHTKMPKNGNAGGAYYIPNEKLSEFYSFYYQDVFVRRKDFHLTETQLSNGQIMIDFDFRYDTSVKERQHGDDHIIELIELITDNLKEIIMFNDADKFDIFVFEKERVNPQDDVTKDGIHICIGINMIQEVQIYLRKKMLEQVEKKSNLSKLPLINTWDKVYDEGIAAGGTKWQLYGSKKPGNLPYELTYHFNVSYDRSQNELDVDQIDVNDFNLQRDFKKLSARYVNPQEFVVKNDILELCMSGTVKKKRKRFNLIKKKTNINEINNEDDLDEALNNILNSLKPADYYIREAHNYAMILPEKYFGEGSYDKWIRVGWALKNTDNRLFLSWVKFSSMSKSFNYNDIGDLFGMWMNFDDETTNSGLLTYRSIIYWAKQDSDPDKYASVHDCTIDYFIELTLPQPDQVKYSIVEFDLAMVLYQIFKDKFVCTNVTKNEWYEFKNNKWHRCDAGTTLRLAISQDMYVIYTKKVHETLKLMVETEDKDKAKKLQVKTAAMTDIGLNLRKTTDKNNIMREAREIFKDDKFHEKLDANTNLLCFENGVFDFEQNIFREGRPEDYISMSTNIDYKPYEKISKKMKGEIELFMEQLFPEKELRDYMYQHLASTCIGNNINNTFNIYTGCGRNGKSVLVDLMSKCLGDYKGTVPITLITRGRTNIGSATPEIARLKGLRYAVMQEPSKREKINEGMLKELTGGVDVLQGRHLHQEPIEFIPQFKLAVTCNTLFDITSNDDGTWRRIRVCDFKSLFTENPVDDDEDKPYQFKVDKNLPVKFEKWKTGFMSKLIEIAKETKGNVEDCDIVVQKSGQYRQGQDYLTEFVTERIEAQEGEKIQKGEVYSEFKQWYNMQYGRKVPQGKELYDFLDKRFGKYNRGGWHNVHIIYDTQ
tara:strand:- start:2030 stop:4753 length:2724 start_codon:yes stop_codon:yes gene_type:complete